MYSVNVPVPSAVGRLATDLARDLPGARERTRDEHTLVCKRLGDAEDGFGRLVARVREAIAGTVPFEARVTGVDAFEDPETGTGPVVYLVVESPGLIALHGHLCEEFEPVAHLEGDAYVPHVTIARGGDVDLARDLTDREVDPISFDVTELLVWDPHRNVTATRLSLPA